MTRFFFHLNECGSVTKDLEGRELPNLDAARACAVAAARDVMSGELAKGTICFSCHIDISDATGTVLETVPFKYAVKIDGL